VENPTSGNSSNGQVQRPQLFFTRRHQNSTSHGHNPKAAEQPAAGSSTRAIGSTTGGGSKHAFIPENPASQRCPVTHSIDLAHG
jgi:hypothetical protein